MQHCLNKIGWDVVNLSWKIDKILLKYRLLQNKVEPKNKEKLKWKTYLERILAIVLFVTYAYLAIMKNFRGRLNLSKIPPSVKCFFFNLFNYSFQENKKETKQLLETISKTYFDWDIWNEFFFDAYFQNPPI